MRQSWVSWINLITGNDPPEQKALERLKMNFWEWFSFFTQEPWSEVTAKLLVIFTSAVALTCSDLALGAVSKSFLMFEETALAVSWERYYKRNGVSAAESVLVAVCLGMFTTSDSSVKLEQLWQ